MAKIWQKLIGQKFDDDNIRPLAIALLCALPTTIISLWNPTHIGVIWYQITERFLYTYFGHVLRIMELSIFLKIVFAISKKGTKFNVLLGQTVLPMCIVLITRVLILTAILYLDMPLLPYRVVIWISTLAVSIYSFLLLRKAHGFSKVSAIIISTIYFFVSVEQVIAGVIMLILGLIKSLSNHVL